MKSALLVLILAVSAAAQSAIPNAPSHVRAQQWEKKPANVWIAPFKDPAFYIGVGNHAASAIVDVHSTQACIANKTCVEAYPGHERYRYVAPLIALEAGAQYGCSLMLSGHKKWRWGCLGISAAMSFYHWKDASTIYKNDLRARP